VLPEPDMLPIGVELKIPPKDRPAVSPGPLSPPLESLSTGGDPSAPKMVPVRTPSEPPAMLPVPSPF
jgi:hypothetical protein